METPHHQARRDSATSCFAGLLAAGAALLSACAGTSKPPEAETTTIYLLRHAEPDFKHPDRPLTERGRVRAGQLITHFARTPITHVYATHTDRTRDTIIPLAQVRGVQVQQFPSTGSTVDGKRVGNRTNGSVAVQPLIAALKSLPAGSTAVVAANSENLYPVLAGMGAPIYPGCSEQRVDCLPCATRKCFDGNRFDLVWQLRLQHGKPAALSRTSYGNQTTP